MTCNVTEPPIFVAIAITSPRYVPKHLRGNEAILFPRCFDEFGGKSTHSVGIRQASHRRTLL